MGRRPIGHPDVRRKRRPLDSDATAVWAWVVAERLTTWGLLGAVLVTVKVPVSEPPFVG